MFVHFIHHWLYEDIWVPVWPNWAADFIVGILVYVFGKRELHKLHYKIEKNHEDLKAHLDAAIEKIAHNTPPSQ
jgi:hypothetical protein